MDNILDGYYIAPAFMDKLVVHITKNYMTLPNIKVSNPLHSSNRSSVMLLSQNRCFYKHDAIRLLLLILNGSDLNELMK